jgi:hypothetical protein
MLPEVLKRRDDLIQPCPFGVESPQCLLEVHACASPDRLAPLFDYTTGESETPHNSTDRRILRHPRCLRLRLGVNVAPEQEIRRSLLRIAQSE